MKAETFILRRYFLYDQKLLTHLIRCGCGIGVTS
jgi:hypothetical protein